MPPSFSRRDISLANWRVHPFTQWTFQNVAEFVPVAEFGARHAETARPESRGVEQLEFPGHDGAAVRVADFLANTHADAFVAMRDGNVLAEWYAPHCGPDRPHLVFSISKSITGLLAGIAVGDGLLDPAAPISKYATVDEGSAYASASVRDLLDMTVSIDFDEDYLNLDGPFDRYRRAMLWNPERPGTTPEALSEVLASLPKGSEPHGKRFFYVSPNTDLMGLVLEGATGQRFHDYLRDRLWLPMGGLGAAYVTVDRLGTARAAGGICVTARDLARLGQLLLDGGTHEGRQIVPAAWIDDLRENGDRQAWLSGNFSHVFPQGRYRSFWYASGNARGCIAADGIHGQRLWIDPVSRVVAVKLSSFPTPTDDAATEEDFAMLARIAETI